MGQRCRKYKEDYVADSTLARMKAHRLQVELERMELKLKRGRRVERIFAALFLLSLAAHAARIALGW